MIRQFRRCAPALALAAACLAPAAQALEIKLPQETAKLHPGTGAGAQAASLCLMCHSVDYVSSQPPMPLGFWEAEVKKMVGTYGAPIPPDQVPLIVEYLNQAYPPATAKP
ncbi:sulfite:cytochrome C oxidoreductase subunit B [Achromobacter xylosoxidans]|nr:sulfite:cytochrome C oxidoreductase subunit B [Achromobacter xylosoxidans]